MHTPWLQRFFPMLAVLGSVIALGIGTSWAKQGLFPLVGAQGTTAVRVGLSALLMLLLWRPLRWPDCPTYSNATALRWCCCPLGAMIFYAECRSRARSRR